MLNRIFLLGLLAIGLAIAEGGSKCPSRSKIHPCYCHEIIQKGQTFTLVTCTRFNSSSDFLDVPRLLDRMMIDRLVLEDYNSTSLTALTLPDGWFANIRLRELEMYNVKLIGVIGQLTFLKGQEKTLVKISLKKSIDSTAALLCQRCTNQNYNQYVDLAVLSIATNLREIDLSWNKISSVASPPFPTQLESLQTIDLSHNSITSIQQLAFRSYLKLNKINLSHNMITTLPSNMFSSQVAVLDFSYNMISSVPADMFTNTTIQGQVLFAHNQLQDLPMNTWLSAIRVAYIVDVSDNFFTCDCSLAWVKSQVKKESQVIGSCTSPGEMELQTLRNINLNQNCTAIV